MERLVVHKQILRVYEEGSCNSLLEMIDKIARVNVNSEFLKTIRLKLKEFGVAQIGHVEHFKEHLRIIIKEIFKFWFLQKFAPTEERRLIEVFERIADEEYASINPVHPPERKKSIFEANTSSKDAAPPERSKMVRLERIEDEGDIF